MTEVEKMAIKLFISHSVDDEELAQALISLLKVTFYFRDWEVRCTSLTGYEPSDEILTTGQLSQELRQAKLVIFILTPFNEESGWLRLELGLTWATHNDPVILLLAGLYFKNLPKDFPETSIVDVSDKDSIYEVLDQIGEILQWEWKPKTEKIGKAIQNMITISKNYEMLEYGSMEEDEDQE
jgi:hypothetical protein